MVDCQCVSRMLEVGFRIVDLDYVNVTWKSCIHLHDHLQLFYSGLNALAKGPFLED